MTTSRTDRQKPRLLCLFWESRNSQDYRVNRRRRCQGIAADDDHGHLHRKCDEIPKPSPEPLRGLNGRVADRDTRDEHDDDCHQSESECIWKPPLKPLGQIQPHACKPRPLCLLFDLHARDCIKFLLLSMDCLTNVIAGLAGCYCRCGL